MDIVVFIIDYICNARNTGGTQGKCNSSRANGCLSLLRRLWFSSAMVHLSLFLSLLVIVVVVFCVIFTLASFIDYSLQVMAWNAVAS